MAKRKIFVEFFYPGTFCSESSVREVENRDPGGLKIPVYAYAFRFFDILESEESNVKLRSNRMDCSPYYFYGGTLYTLDEIREYFPEEKSLIERMERHGWDKAVCTGRPQWVPFEKGAVLIVKGTEARDGPQDP